MLRKCIYKCLESGHIVPSASLYGHPVLLAENKVGGGLCLCVNYHALNANMEIDAWPLLYIDDLLSGLKGAKVFSSLDLYNGYH